MATIGITLGDINGVGPEIAVAAACHPDLRASRVVLIGDPSVVEAACRLRKLTLPDRVRVWDPRASTRSIKRTPGVCSAPAARAAYEWIVASIAAAREGTLDAIVTAPINKEGFMKAGIDVPGHTELLAQQCGVKKFDMMLLCDNFRVVLATRHVPLRDVASTLTRTGIRDTITLTADALDWLGARKRRIAVCGLNPHAGDGGAIGDEERTLIAPAMKAVRRPDVALYGPIPADTVFYQVRQGCYDAVVAMYHDQALAPFKMIAFESGVNLTLGLPIVRTSPDHGTAYDIAWKGKANASSMIEAVRLAARLARRPNPWRRS